jgi:hypothetical protein
MELRVEISGEIVERQELLNGTETVTIEGADAAGEWALTGALSWNLGLVDYAGEGDLTLARRDGAELFGTLTRARVTEVAGDTGEADHEFRAAYEIDGGAGAFEGVSGESDAAGSFGGDSFRGVWSVRLTAP